MRALAPRRVRHIHRAAHKLEGPARRAVSNEDDGTSKSTCWADFLGHWLSTGDSQVEKGTASTARSPLHRRHRHSEAVSLASLVYSEGIIALSAVRIASWNRSFASWICPATFTGSPLGSPPLGSPPLAKLWAIGVKATSQPLSKPLGIKHSQRDARTSPDVRNVDCVLVP